MATSLPSHQLAAIMFTDLAGYTAAMGKDETGTLEQLRKNRNIHKQLIGEFNGAYIKEMGDGNMAKFDNAGDAVLCAKNILIRGKDLNCKIRIGIHLGYIWIENEDLFGDGVNIASRLESVAEPGGIFISDSVYEATGSNTEVDARLIGKIRLKNVSEPVVTYFISGDGIAAPSQNRIRELTGTGEIKSLAILPFRNLSENLEQERYFVDGMQDSLIGELSQISSIRVISRTSTLQYRDTTKSIPEIASELDVDAIMEATVFKNHNKVRINAQLNRAFPREQLLWSGAYEREIKDIFTLFNEVIKDITTEIGTKLTSKESKHLEVEHEIDPKALEAHLKGTFHWQTLSPKDLKIALSYFEQATKIDPLFAPAYSGMAAVWAGRMQMGLISPREAIPNIKSNIQKTIELDGNIADSYFWNAILMVWTDWNWSLGKENFEKVIELNPNHAMARAYYSHLLIIMGDVDEAIRQIEESIELDPFNTLTQSLYGMILNYVRDYSKALKVLKAILNKDHNHPVALSTLRSTYHNQKNYPRAFEAFKQSYLEKGDLEAVETLENEYNKNGYQSALEKIAELMISRSGNKYDSPWQIATLYTRAGITNKAILYLQEAYKIRDPNIPYIGVDPIFDDLRNEEGFIDLVNKMKLDSFVMVENK